MWRARTAHNSCGFSSVLRSTQCDPSLIPPPLFYFVSQMESNLKRVIGDLNKSRGLGETGNNGSGSSSNSSSSEGSNPIAKVCDNYVSYQGLYFTCFTHFSCTTQIVAVLNNHHESLAWLDEKSRYNTAKFCVLFCDLEFVYPTTLCPFWQANAPRDCAGEEGNELPHRLLINRQMCSCC